MLPVDEDLRNGRSTVGAPDHLFAQGAAPGQLIGLIVDALRIEQLTRLEAKAARRLHVNLHPGQSTKLLSRRLCTRPVVGTCRPKRPYGAQAPPNSRHRRGPCLDLDRMSPVFPSFRSL